MPGKLFLVFAKIGVIPDFEEILRMNQDLLMLETATVTANKNEFTAQSQIDYLLSKEEKDDNKN